MKLSEFTVVLEMTRVESEKKALEIVEKLKEILILDDFDEDIYIGISLNEQLKCRSELTPNQLEDYKIRIAKVA